MSRSPIEMVPSASRLMGSLRDVGYDLGSAIADLVDNSIDAGAELVQINLTHKGASSWVRIVDDGVGMTERSLDEAMRYGSRRPYAGDDLGRFGLGLKTASLSQCKSLTVASRTTPRGRVAVRRWDLDKVSVSDSWLLEQLTPRTSPAAAIAPLRDQCGTVVLWEKLDRLAGFTNPDSSWAEAALERDAGLLRDHLAMVFHRFLDGTAPGPALRVLVNAVHVTPWDPFSRDEPATETLAPQSLSYESRGGRRHLVRVSPFILPSRLQYGSPEAHDLAGGPRRWNRQQGLYIYRNDRLIQSGGWNRLRTMDEHSKLARLAVDVPDGAEADWRLNVSKMSVSVPEPLRGELRTLLGSVVSRAQDKYRAAPGAPAKEPAEVESGLTQGGDLQLQRFRLADHWSAISTVLEAELGSDPERLDRILERLINSDGVRTGNPKAA